MSSDLDQRLAWVRQTRCQLTCCRLVDTPISHTISDSTKPAFEVACDRSAWQLFRQPTNRSLTRSIRISRWPAGGCRGSWPLAHDVRTLPSMSAPMLVGRPPTSMRKGLAMMRTMTIMRMMSMMRMARMMRTMRMMRMGMHEDGADDDEAPPQDSGNRCSKRDDKLRLSVHSSLSVPISRHSSLSVPIGCHSSLSVPIGRHRSSCMDWLVHGSSCMDWHSPLSVHYSLSVPIFSQCAIGSPFFAQCAHRLLFFSQCAHRSP